MPLFGRFGRLGLVSLQPARMALEAVGRKIPRNHKKRPPSMFHRCTQMFLLRWQQCGHLSVLMDQLLNRLLYVGDLSERWRRIDKYVCAGLCLLSAAQLLSSALYVVEWRLGELDERELFPDVILMHLANGVESVHFSHSACHTDMYFGLYSTGIRQCLVTYHSRCS